MSYSENEIAALVSRQREYFENGKTLSVKFRIGMLKKLRENVKKNEKEIADALRKDLSRSAVEAYLCDTGPIIAEINEIIRGLSRWAKPEKHFSGLLCFPSVKTTVYKMPYGVTLIISPYNFPFLLTFGVLAASISGGNTAIIKTSSKSAASTEIIKKIVKETFPPEYVAVVDGGHDVADCCLNQRFDKIFYTGSPAVAKHISEKAAVNLTPVVLELGGETGNWCIVRKDADIKDAARKIAFFKLCNAGQICININQVAVAEEIAGKFTEELKKAFEKQIGKEPEKNAEYPRLISGSAYDKCATTAEKYKDRIIFGGRGDRNNLKFAPTVIFPVEKDEEIVKRELFSPLLPVIPFPDGDADGIIKTISEREHPLALYLFTSDIKWADKVMSSSQYGGGCINEVCIQLMVKGVPFNGTGHSGFGAYHGEWGFREFTHPSTVLTGKTHFNLSLREHPYGGKSEKKKLKILHLLEK